jgi:hypothetical protein
MMPHEDRGFCVPHFERTALKVPAVRKVGDLPMCAACFAGQPIVLSVEVLGESFANRRPRSEARIKQVKECTQCATRP